ncbi:MAG: hypothetical protein U0231_15570 [Nitrospiraceae bacterium]
MSRILNWCLVALDPVLFKPDYQVELTDATWELTDEKTMLSRSSPF